MPQKWGISDFVRNHDTEGRMRLESISRKVRQRFYYSVPIAGAKVDLGRSQSYRAAEDGLIPTVRNGKFLLVPRKRWDRTVKRLLRGGNAPPGAAKPEAKRQRERAAAEITTTA
jgi:hypothetical protein